MSSPSDELLLLIRCPSCGQRFKVGEDLRDKTVECGACEARFKISDEVIVRGRKFYPGEKSSPGVNRFQRVPLSLTNQSIGIERASYAQAPDPSLLEPTSPLKVLAGIVGVSGMAITALLLMFGGRRGALLDGMTFEKRLLMAGFMVLLGIGLLVFANPRARAKALLIGAMLGLGVMILPFCFREGSVLLESPVRAEVVGEEEAVAGPSEELTGAKEEVAETDELRELRLRIGTDPLVKEINRLAAAGSTKQAYGIWLRGMVERHRLLIRDYIFRATDANPSSASFYPRGDGDFLLVIAEPKQDLEGLALVASALGKVEGIYTEIAVIEVRVNNDNFTEGPIEKLTDNEDPAFYDLNKRELNSIDLDRVKRAVQRLGKADPKVYRTDITRRFVSLLGEERIDFKGDLCSALAVWSEQEGVASEAAVKVMNELMERNQKVPVEMVSLIVKEKNAAGIPGIHQLWLASPNSWEELYSEFGPAIEGQVLGSFFKTEGAVRHSAIRLLGIVGGEESLEVLQAVFEGATTETRILLEKAQDAIRQRLGR